MGENKNAMPILRKRQLKRRLLCCAVLFLILGAHVWKNRLRDEDSFDDDDDDDGLMRKNANEDGRKKSLRSRGRGDDETIQPNRKRPE